MRELHMQVTGKVQGVGFRAFVQRKALALAVVGFAQNRSDGSVEVVAQGTEQNLRRLVLHVRSGPRMAQVDAVEEVWGEPSRTYTGFHTR